MVKKLFTIQATSCAVERTFVTGGLTVTAKRTKLNPDNVPKTAFIHENIKKLNLPRLINSNGDEEQIKKAIKNY